MGKKDNVNLVKLNTEKPKIKIITLSDEEKEVCLKPVNDLFFTVTQLSNQITNGSYTEEIKENMLNLAEHYIAELRRLL